MAKGNLFSKAAKTAVSKTTKAKETKPTVEIKDPEFFDKVSRLAKLQDNLKRDKAEADMINDEIKDIGKSQWCEIYEKTGSNPGSIVLSSKKDSDLARVMLVPSDGYIKINKDRAGYITEQYGEDIVEEKVSFEFDNDMIEKYGEVLSRLIEESEEIDEDDKDKIIKAVATFNIAKGTIDKLKEYGEVKSVIEEVRPIIALKNVEVING